MEATLTENAQNGVGRKHGYCCGLMATRFIFDDGTVKNEVTRRRQTRQEKKYLHQTIQQRNAQWTGMTNCADIFTCQSTWFQKSGWSKLFLVGGYGIGECLHSL
jgi:hypothetical protein